MATLNIEDIVKELEDFYEVKTPKFTLTYVKSREEFEEIIGHKNRALGGRFC